MLYTKLTSLHDLKKTAVSKPELFAKVSRFASILKCGSRSLLDLGLLGELPGQFHSCIKSYPQWWLYRWYEVTRPDSEWLESWWNEMRKDVQHLAEVLNVPVCELRPDGMQFTNMDADLAMLSDPKTLASLPSRLFVNAWLPDNCVAEYAAALAKGKSFKEYCIETIIDGMPCVQIPLAELDSFLESQGFTPVHKNAEIEHAVC